MRNYNLSIAGYNIRFETSHLGPALMPAKRFLRNIVDEEEEFTPHVKINVHSGKISLPEGSERVFHAPFVEEINGIQIRHKANFWSVWKEGTYLYIKTFFPLTTPKRHAVLKFSLKYNTWDLWIESNGKLIDPFEYPLDGLILYYLTVIHNDIMIHASGVNFSGKGYLFSGTSGKGKTTIAGLFARAGGRIIHDDRLILRSTGEHYLMYNTPVYNNDEPLQSRLDKIYLIDHGSENRIIPIAGAKAVSMVMANCIQHNWGNEIINQLLNSISWLCEEVPVFRLSFKPDQSVIDHILEYEYSDQKP
jgi:hypothetical protein